MLLQSPLWAQKQTASIDLKSSHFAKIEYLINNQLSLAEKSLKPLFTKALKEKDRISIIAYTAYLAIIETKTNRSTDALALLNKCIHDQEAQKSNLIQSSILYETLSACWYELGNYDSAQFYANKNIQLIYPDSSSIQFVRQKIIASRIAIKQGFIENALKDYDKAQTLSRLKNYEQVEADLKNLEGQLFYAQKLYDKADQCFILSLKKYAQQNNKSGQALNYIHLGNVSYLKYRDDSAKNCYNKATQLFKEIGDISGIAICKSNLSRIYLEASKHKEAVEEAKDALSLIKGGGYAMIEAGTLQQMGDIYGELNKPDSAVFYIKEALNIAQKMQHKTLIRDCYKSLSELYQSQKNYSSAYDYLLKAYRIKDSIQAITYNRKLAEMEALYESQKKDNAINLLNAQQIANAAMIEKQDLQSKKQKAIFIGVGIILCLVIVALYFYYSGKQLKEQILLEREVKDAEEKERIRIAKDIHDDLGSGLSKIKFIAQHSLIEKDNDPNDKLKKLQHIASISGSLIGNMRDIVWAMHPDNNLLEILIVHIREYAYDYFDDTSIHLQLHFPDQIPQIKISKEWNRNVFMIFKECLQNIVKHSEATEVVIRLTLDTQFYLSVKDNGKGFQLKENNLGNGLKNMHTRAQAVKINYHINTQLSKGTESIIVSALKDIST